MSLLCLELYPPGEVSAGTAWLTLVVGVGCRDRVVVDLGVVCSMFALGEDMAALDLVNLGGLGIVFAPGADMAALVLVNLGGLGTVFAPGVDMATLFLVYLGGLGCVFGIGEDMAGLVLVTLGGVGTVSVVSMVWLPLVVRWPCSWLLL